MAAEYGVVHVNGKYPFWLWQMGVGVPLMIGLIVRQARQPDPRRIWIYGACLGPVVNFFGRIFFDRYMGFYVVVALLGRLADPTGNSELYGLHGKRSDKPANTERYDR